MQPKDIAVEALNRSAEPFAEAFCNQPVKTTLSEYHRHLTEQVERFVRESVDGMCPNTADLKQFAVDNFFHDISKYDSTSLDRIVSEMFIDITTAKVFEEIDQLLEAFESHLDYDDCTLDGEPVQNSIQVVFEAFLVQQG